MHNRIAARTLAPMRWTLVAAVVCFSAPATAQPLFDDPSEDDIARRAAGIELELERLDLEQAAFRDEHPGTRRLFAFGASLLLLSVAAAIVTVALGVNQAAVCEGDCASNDTRVRWIYGVGLSFGLTVGFAGAFMLIRGRLMRQDAEHTFRSRRRELHRELEELRPRIP